MRKIFKFILIGIIFLAVSIYGFLKFSSHNKVQSVEEVQKNEQIVEEKKDIETTLAAGGDVMLSRYVGTKIRKSGDMALPFRKISNIFSEADIAFINLESPFYNQGEYVTDGMVFKSEPETIEGLNLAGIDIVSMANNHAKNRGSNGLLYSFDLLNKNNIEYAGAGRNFNEAHQEKIIEKEEIKFAFLAYTYSDGANFKSSVTSNDPDVAFMNILEMKKDVERARKTADVIIVSMHAGAEYQNYPNVEQKEFAREAIDAGANLVLGHHPHVVQTTEKYNNGFIIYSLGNLVFDQMWSQETQEGVIASCKFVNKNLKQINFIPIKIENYNQPRKATDIEAKGILKRMNLEESTIDL